MQLKHNLRRQKTAIKSIRLFNNKEKSPCVTSFPTCSSRSHLHNRCFGIGWYVQLLLQADLRVVGGKSSGSGSAAEDALLISLGSASNAGSHKVDAREVGTRAASAGVRSTVAAERVGLLQSGILDLGAVSGPLVDRVLAANKLKDRVKVGEEVLLLGHFNDRLKVEIVEGLRDALGGSIDELLRNSGKRSIAGAVGVEPVEGLAKGLDVGKADAASCVTRSERDALGEGHAGQGGKKEEDTSHCFGEELIVKWKDCWAFWRVADGCCWMFSLQ